eukprot:PhF_6_TR26353/c0_g1_i2/m.37951
MPTKKVLKASSNSKGGGGGGGGGLLPDLLSIHRESIAEENSSGTFPPPSPSKQGGGGSQQQQQLRRTTFVAPGGSNANSSSNNNNNTNNVSSAANVVKVQHGMRVIFEITKTLDALREVATEIKNANIYEITQLVLKDWAANVLSCVDRATDALEGNADLIVDGLMGKRTNFSFQNDMATPRGGRRRSSQTDTRTHSVVAESVQSSKLHFNATYGNLRSESMIGPTSPMTMSRNPIHQVVLSSLYLGLESVCQLLRADYGVLLLSPPESQTGELRAASHYGVLHRGEERITNLMSHPAGICFRTGILLNCSRGQKVGDVRRNMPMDGTDERKALDLTWSSLSVPIPNHTTRKPMGVLYLANKDNGTMSFDVEDEYVAFGSAHLLGAMTA